MRSVSVRYHRKMVRVIVVVGDNDARERLRESVASCGYTVVDALANGRPPIADVVIADPETILSGGVSPAVNLAPVIVVTSHPSITDAVDCMRAGAADYLAAPLRADALDAAITAALAKRRPPTIGYPLLVGACDAMRALGTRIAVAARSESPVLIHGEAGTGKELVARALHAASARRHAPLITLRCATIPAALIEAELFGHAGGTGRRGLLDTAACGTLFLDDVDELPLAAQTRLAETFQASRAETAQSLSPNAATPQEPKASANVRIVAATRCDLAALTQSGQFQRSVWTWLRRQTLAVPPLRERGEDVVHIAQAALSRNAAKLNKRIIGFGPAAEALLRRYRWPGNVRELENAVERAVILCEGPNIAPELLAIDAAPRAADGDGATQPDPRPPPNDDDSAAPSGALESFFLRFVLANQDQLTETELACKLGISRKSLWERRQRLNIPRRRTRKRGPRRGQT